MNVSYAFPTGSIIIKNNKEYIKIYSTRPIVTDEGYVRAYTKTELPKSYVERALQSRCGCNALGFIVITN